MPRSRKAQVVVVDKPVYNPKNPKPPLRKHIQPKNEKQQLLLDGIRYFPITVTIGCAGTGKTYCSTSQVVNEFLTGKYKKIILTRANIATGKSLGFFPGTVAEKMAPWLLPITSVLELQFGKHYYDYLVAKGTIEIQPLETIRGRSYEDSLCIVDECQNITHQQTEMMLGRLGKGGKMIFCGDMSQVDLPKGKKDSGISFFTRLEENIKGVKIIILKKNHRHEIVEQILKTYEEFRD